jgi:hypothetical protein
MCCLRGTVLNTRNFRREIYITKTDVGFNIYQKYPSEILISVTKTFAILSAFGLS